jgi:hypothetical protein
MITAEGGVAAIQKGEGCQAVDGPETTAIEEAVRRGEERSAEGEEEGEGRGGEERREGKGGEKGRAMATAEGGVTAVLKGEGC